MSFYIQEHTSFGVPCKKRNRKVISFVLSPNEGKRALGVVLYMQTMRRL